MVEETRERVLDEAGKLFLRYGFRRTTMEEIAALVGMSKAALYLHFRNKEDIFGQFCTREARHVLGLLRQIQADSLPPNEKLSALLLTAVTQVWDFCHQAPHAPEVWAESMMAVHENVAPARRQAEQIIAEVIAEGQADGTFCGSIDAAKIAPLVRLAFAGFNVPYLEIQTREQLLEQAPQLVAILIRGLRAAEKDLVSI